MAKRKNRSITAIVENKDFMVTLFSGAIDYSMSTPFKVLTTDEVKNVNNPQNTCREDVWADVILSGGNLTIEDTESGKTHEINLAKIKRGFKRFMFDCPKKYAELMCEEGDFYTYDNLLQVIIYGEVIYD